MQQHGSKYSNILPADTPPPLGMGPIGQNSTFSEHGHVTYQFKGNHEMQQHGSKYFARRPLPLFADTPPPPPPPLPKVNFGVGEMGFMFCDLKVYLK